MLGYVACAKVTSVSGEGGECSCHGVFGKYSREGAFNSLHLNRNECCYIRLFLFAALSAGAFRWISRIYASSNVCLRANTTGVVDSA